MTLKRRTSGKKKKGCGLHTAKLYKFTAMAGHSPFPHSLAEMKSKNWLLSFNFNFNLAKGSRKHARQSWFSEKCFPTFYVYFFI